MKELALAKRFPSGERFTAVTVVRRDGGLAPGDLAAIEGVRASLAAAPPVTGSRAVIGAWPATQRSFLIETRRAGRC